MSAAVEKFRPKPEDTVTVSPAAVRAATEVVFNHCGLTADASVSCADVLLTNDLRGVESHGVSNMLRQYAARYTLGQYNAHPNIQVTRETSTTANIDADHANVSPATPPALSDRSQLALSPHACTPQPAARPSCAEPHLSRQCPP